MRLDLGPSHTVLGPSKKNFENKWARIDFGAEFLGCEFLIFSEVLEGLASSTLPPDHGNIQTTL